jgi:hypothetical protein
MSFLSTGNIQGHQTIQQESPSISIGHTQGHNAIQEFPPVFTGRLLGQLATQECPSLPLIFKDTVQYTRTSFSICLSYSRSPCNTIRMSFGIYRSYSRTSRNTTRMPFGIYLSYSGHHTIQ